ncbi:MAG: class I SAM-dependent methyltransferase [Cyanobacteriota bacterium]|nr:class I SAM-dependent methyltransferase [Cyanobacteriota bacterium]
MHNLTEVFPAGEVEINTSYEPFSQEPEYIEANRLFIETLPLEGTRRILDLACGTGTMTEGLLKQCQKLQGNRTNSSLESLPKVVGVDLSRESLLLGQEHLAQLGFLVPPTPSTTAGGAVILVEGTADCLPIADRSVDFVMMGNAIHMVSDRQALFGEVARVLQPGGYFAFNTSFYAGTYVPGTEHIYMRWMQEAIAYIQKCNSERKAAGLPAIARQRGQAARAFSSPWLSADDYTRELGGCGLQVQTQNERTVMLTQRSFETIGAYTGLAKVLLSGYPVKFASEALVKAAEPTLVAVEMPEVPRYWLEMVFQKTTD